MNQKPVFFKLFACCLIAKGFTRSIIYDLQRKEYHIFPNSLYDILHLYPNKSIQEIKDQYDEASHPIIDTYFQYLFDKELAFPCNYDDLSHFPDLNLQWETPLIIENFILDIDKKSNHDFVEIINSLSQITLKVIQLRFFYDADIYVIEKIMQLIRKSDIRTVELIVPNNESIDEDKWVKLTEENLKLITIIIYNSTKYNIKYNKQAAIIQTEENVLSPNGCGKVSKELFTCNLNLFKESQNYNTCLNCKASIDVNGEIKNCPSMPQSFGHYKNVSLENIVKTPEFQRLWKIKKDDIEVCKDCEFRYMCTDCRVFIKNSLNIYSQPAKCTYNPYIAKWEGENGYYTVEEWGKNNNE